MKRLLGLVVGYLGTIIFLYSCLFAQENSDNNISEEMKEIMVIINKELPNKIFTEIELKDIYLGKMQFFRGIKLLPTNQKSKEIFAAFLKKFIGMTATEYKNYWVKKVFAEGGTIPYVLENSNSVKKYVSENKGALGYLEKRDLTDEERNFFKNQEKE